MSKKWLRIFGGILALATTGLWFFRYDLSFGSSYSKYDITVVDTLSTHRRGVLQFGTHQFMAGGFKGSAINIGVTAPIPDSVTQEFGSQAILDPKYLYVDKDGIEHYNGPYIPDPPSQYVKIPVLSRLPQRWPWQKYHFKFVHFPNDSIRLEIQVLSKDDCSHINPLAATAFLSSGPCSF